MELTCLEYAITSHASTQAPANPPVCLPTCKPVLPAPWPPASHECQGLLRRAAPRPPHCTARRRLDAAAVLPNPGEDPRGWLRVMPPTSACVAACHLCAPRVALCCGVCSVRCGLRCARRRLRSVRCLAASLCPMQCAERSGGVRPRAAAVARPGSPMLASPGFASGCHVPRGGCLWQRVAPLDPQRLGRCPHQRLRPSVYLGRERQLLFGPRLTLV